MLGEEERRHVLVAVPTYRRTELLPALLTEIATQLSTELADGAGRLLVVDNDPARSAEAIASSSGVDYAHQPIPGIAAVRQLALESTRPGDLLIMVDDDVFPEPGWLHALLRTWEECRPTAVLGYVRYVWPEGTDPWVAAGGFLRRTPHPTGTKLSTFVTGNVLLDSDALRASGIGFDLSLGLSGGEDTRLGQDILRAGGLIVACAESICRDDIPQERTTRDFVRTRTISHGEIRVRVDLHGRRGSGLAAGRVLAFGGAVARWLVFTATHLIGRVTGDLQRDAVSQRRAWFAIGRMRAATGRWGEEYARRD